MHCTDHVTEYEVQRFAVADLQHLMCDEETGKSEWNEAGRAEQVY